MDPHDHEQPLQKPGAPEGAGGPASDPTLEALEEKIKGLRQSLEELRRGAQAEEGSAPEERGEESASSEEPPGSEQAQGAPDQEAGEGEPEGRLESRGRDQPLALFDGWRQAAGAWNAVGGATLEAREEGLFLQAGEGRGLAYHRVRRFDDFRLRVEYRLEPADAPMAAAVRFLDPEQPVPDRNDPEKKYPYDNPSYVASHTGYEVWMAAGRGREAGTLAAVPFGDGPGAQQHPKSAALKGDGWNELVIEVRGNRYSVRLNGAETARFESADAWRGRPASAAEGAGYLGFTLGERSRVAGESPPQRREVRTPSGPAVQPPGGAPLTPGQGGRATPRPQAPAGRLIVRRAEVWTLEPEAAGRQRRAPKRLSAQDMATLHAEVTGALARIESKHPGVNQELRKAHGYAVFPSVGRASLLLGGARGYGEVFERGKSIGFARLTQVTFGVQVGGQTFSELVQFGSREALEAFKRSPVTFNANLSALFIRGASGTTNFKDVTARAYSRGGMLLEASLGGQKFTFMPQGVPVEEEGGGGGKGAALRSGASKVGHAAKVLAGMASETGGRLAGHAAKTLASKAGGLFQKKDKSR